jgi:multiple sugar transport system substrate-binding protein
MPRRLLVLIVLAALLAACGGAAAPQAPAEAPTAAPAAPAPTAAPAATAAPAPTAAAQPADTTAAPAASAPAQITYMMWGSPEELAVWQKIVDDFQAANPGIKVKVDVSDWDSYWNKLKTLYAAGTPPDVFAMDGPLYPDWAGRGVLLNLQPYVDKSPGLLDGLYPNTLETYKRDDGFYGLPRDLQPIVLFYNKDMFDAAKLPYPTDKWTMDDLRKVAKQLTKDTNGDGKLDQWGFATDLWDMELFWSEAIWGYGGEILSPARDKTLIADGKAHDAWKYIADMVLQDKSVPSPAISAEYGNDPFGAGVAAMTTIGHWIVPTYAQAKFKWDVAAMPAGPSGRATSVNSAGFVISKDTKNPDAAWEFVKFAVGPAGQQRLTELGFAVPILKSIAESPTFLKQSGASINQQVFLDALGYARAKPSFKGYDEWAAAVGDNLVPVWNGEKPLDEALDEIVPQADEALSKNK